MMTRITRVCALVGQAASIIHRSQVCFRSVLGLHHSCQAENRIEVLTDNALELLTRFPEV